MKTLSGLQRVCKMFGRMNCGGTMMVWDYVNECAVEENEFRKDKERIKASEMVKWKTLKTKTL